MSSKQIKSYSHSFQELEEAKETHPFQYLTNLNHVFNHCNRSTTKDYSSTSKIKLPFKKFNNIKIPECFQESYKKEKKEFVNINVSCEMKEDDMERKLWKEHKEIIRKYIEHRKSKDSKKIANQQNKSYSEKIILKDKNNLFLKKIIEKGTNFTYDQKKFQTEILNKLKNLSKSKFRGVKRSNTIKNMAFGDSLKESSKGQKAIPQKYEVTVKDYLDVTQQQELIKKYKNIIKHVDCSISSKNIEKTTLLLEHMQKLVDKDYQV